MNPSFSGSAPGWFAGACPQCGSSLPSGYQQGWMGTYPGGSFQNPAFQGFGGPGQGYGSFPYSMAGNPYTWFGTYPLTYQGGYPGFGYQGGFPEFGAQGWHPGWGQGFGFQPSGWSGYPASWFGTYTPAFQGWHPGFGYQGGYGYQGGFPGHGFQGAYPGWMGGFGFQGGYPGWMGGYGQPGFGFGPAGRHWGGTYAPQYVAGGLPTDEEITEMIYDALDVDPLVPWDADIDVNVDAGTVTLSGTVPNKRIKHAAGDDAWWIPGVIDVQNNLQVTGRRGRGEAAQAGQAGAQPSQTMATGAARRRSSTGQG